MVDQQIKSIGPGPVNLSVSIPRDRLNALVAMLGDKRSQFNRIMAQSINETLKAGQVAVGRLVRSSLNMPVDESKKVVTLIRANRTRPWGMLNITRKAVPLKRFRPRQTKRGVSVTVRKGKRELIEGAFINPTLGDHVFQRKSVYNRRKGLAAVKDVRKMSRSGKGKSALPIQKLFGPTLIGLIANKPYALESIRIEMAERLINRFTSKANYLLTRKVVPGDSATT